MNTPLHTVELTDEQLYAVKQLFNDKGWDTALHSSTRLNEMQETADDYVEFHTTMLNGTDSPRQAKAEASSAVRQLRQSEPTKSHTHNGTSYKLDKTQGSLKSMKQAGMAYTELRNSAKRESPDEEARAEVSPMVQQRLQGEPNKFRTNNGTSYKLDKTQGSFKTMKQAGMAYTELRNSAKRESPGEGVYVTMRSPVSTSQTLPGGHNQSRRDKGQWRMSTLHEDQNDEDEVDSDINFNNFIVSDRETVKVITKLSTEHVRTVSCVPVRIVLLVDRSGSMLHKLGRDGRHPKITKVKHFARQLINSLDDGDEAALVTFGDGADIFFPLEKLNARSRTLLSDKLNKLDQGNMSRSTNLSAGLRMALKVFYNASNGKSDYLSRKNSILVLSDGEINAGTTETNSLIHEVRQNIRQMVPELDDSQNQWVTISVVTTGSEVSEQAYMLSKTCSSEAFYYIDKDSEDPEADLFLPVLLRKAAVVWNISYVIEAYHGIQFIPEKCSKENRVRLRRSTDGGRSCVTEKAYFLYDFPAGHSREIGIGANWKGVRGIEELKNDAVVFRLRVEFTNIKGERFWQEQSVLKGDVVKAIEGNNFEANVAACKHDLRLVSSDILGSAAEHIKAGDKRSSKAVMIDGQKDVKSLLEALGQKSRAEDKNTSDMHGLQEYAKCVVENMGQLIDTIERSSEGTTWNKIKAVSTAISRESPNVSDTVVDGDVLCPFPKIVNMQTGAMKDPFEKMMAKNKNHKRITFGNFDSMLDDILPST